MLEEIQTLLDEYMKWLKDKTQLRQVQDWVEITTPYLDRHNDYIQIYARKNNGDYTLTDDGYTIQDLEQSGCSLHTPKRQDLLKVTLNGFGVQLVDGRLEVQSSRDNFPLRKHNLIQAVLAINDMFFTARSLVANLFLEDVTSWLDSHEVRYTPRVKFTGKSGYDHVFDFVIPKSKQQPERMVQTINRASKEKAQAVAFSWIDTREVRPTNSKAYAFINDSEQSVSTDVREALLTYDVHPIPWSGRDQALEELAA